MLLDANAQRLWDKSFGDRAYDQLLALCVTRDGGFAFAGTSSYYPEPTSHSSIFRLDPNGNLLWKRPLPQFYSISSLRETTDGDLILGATSQEPEAFHFALLRFDAGGDLLWQKTYGGVGGGADLLTTLDITPDSGFILGGSSYSGTGGDKTGLQYGEYDWWLVRVDSHGNKLWDLTFGGPTEDHLESIQATTDGSFILAGSTDDWSDLRSTLGADDFWVIKLGPEDCDGDGVPDSFDLCPGTPPGAIVNAHGCSVEQLCPCNGPWHTHGEYTQSVKESARAFLNAGLITESQMRALVKHAANSSCGK